MNNVVLQTHGQDVHLLARTDPAGLLRLVNEQFQGFSYLGDRKIYVDGVVLASVQQEGGHEGDGEYAHVVFDVSIEGTHVNFIMLTGFYSSWDGTAWNVDEVKVVTPREKTIIVYE